MRLASRGDEKEDRRAADVTIQKLSSPTAAMNFPLSFASCEDDRYFGTVLKLLYMAGLRDAEGTHLKWADIDFKREQIKVSAKPDLGFRLKDREERVIPMPPELVRVLKERRKVCPVKHRLVVGTADDKPHTKWLRLLKRAARERPA